MRLTPRFEFLLDDLSKATDEQLLSRVMGLFASIAAIFLRDARICHSGEGWNPVKRTEKEDGYSRPLLGFKGITFN